MGDEPISEEVEDVSENEHPTETSVIQDVLKDLCERHRSSTPYSADDTDIVWAGDFGGNAIYRFDPTTGTLTTFALLSDPGNLHQLLVRPREVWVAETAADQLVVIRRG